MAIWSDNVVAEGSLRKASAKQWDHTCVVHALWKRAAEIGMRMRIHRVPTKDNPADAPSRGDYRLLRWLGATWCEPVLASAFKAPGAWDALRLASFF